MDDILKLVLLAVLGVLAGFLNVTAGGGSLLTMPFLIFLGLPAAVANGTNRIALMAQNISAVTRFHQLNVIPKGMTFIVTLPAVAGSLLGAQLAVDIDELLFKRILAVVMLLVMAATFFRPGRAAPDSDIALTGRGKVVLAGSFFAIGIYGGFIQAGVGFLIIAVLSLAGYDLVRTNALKVLVVLIYTPFALGIFIFNGQVDYLMGFALAIGNGIGGWLASKIVVGKGHNFVRWIVIATVVVFAVKLFLE